MWGKVFVFGVIYYGMAMAVHGQGSYDSLAFVNGQSIEVGRNVTTNLQFHYRIRQVDRGSGALMARVCNDTVLLLRAALANFPATNLSVYTSDGRLHGFWVSYAEKPVHPWVQLEDSSPIQRVSDVRYYTEDMLARLCDSVWVGAGRRHGVKARQYDLTWRLGGIYSQDGLLFFPLELVNHSSIDYDLERVRFIIRDKRLPKRVATQERELSAAYFRGDTSRIQAGERRRLVYVLPAFMAGKNRRLQIIIEEKGGGRALLLEVTSKRLAKAARIE